MTAASGVLHEEKHGKEFTERGGDFEMVQLWVNLPAAHKMSKPRYQAIVSDSIPRCNSVPERSRASLPAIWRGREAQPRPSRR